MIQDLKALIVVLVLSLPVWWLARRFMIPGCTAEVFARRRLAWFVITVAAFLAPSIWLYALVAVPMMVWARRHDPNAAALYIVLLYAVPNASIELPGFLVNQLFAVNHQRLLACAVLIPLVLERAGDRRWDFMDTTLFALLGLMLVLLVPYETGTSTLRRMLLLLIDTGALFFVFSRAVRSAGDLKDCAASWVLSGLLLATVGVFETLRGWLLYVPIGTRWGDDNVFAFLLRAGSLRAQASAGHSLTLGIWIGMALILLLNEQRTWARRSDRVLAIGLMLLGLWASYARGAWVAALAGCTLLLLLNPAGTGKGLRSAMQLGLVITLLMASPLGDNIVKYLPFIGTVDSGNVEYRQRLFELSMTLIQQNPLFGNPFVETQMESLRQGQGIIDFVNGYIKLALFYGLAGAGLFSLLLVTGLFRGFQVWRNTPLQVPLIPYLAAAFVAAMLANTLFIATASYDPMTFIMAGLMASLWHVARTTGDRTARTQP